MSFPKYKAYKNSGVEWLGEVPEHWEIKHAKYVFVLQRGHDLASTQMEKGRYPVFGSNGIIGFHNVYTTSAPNVTVGRSGSVGLINYVEEDFWAHNTSLFVKDFCEYDPRFIFYLLIAIDPIRLASGSAVGTLDRNNVHVQIVAAPTYLEATSISRFLDYEIARIDALIAEQQRLIELLKEKRQAVISHAVTKGLDPTVPMKDSGVEWLGEVPEHWAVLPLMRLTPDNRKIMYGIVLPGPDFPGGVPIVKGGDVKVNRLQRNLLSRTDPDIEARYVRSRLKKGDIVYSIRGGIGDAELVPEEIEGANITQDAARVSPLPSIERLWLLMILKSAPVFAQLESGALGATIRGINIFDLKRARIPVPPRNEQNKIATNLETKLGLFQQLMTEAKNAVSLLQERRSALISAAVTGKIDVRDWQPPADS